MAFQQKTAFDHTMAFWLHLQQLYWNKLSFVCDFENHFIDISHFLCFQFVKNVMFSMLGYYLQLINMIFFAVQLNVRC